MEDRGMQEVYLIMSDNGQRTKVASIILAKEKVPEYFELLDNNHSSNLIREEHSKYNVKYYALENDEKIFKEHLYVEKKVAIN